MKSRYFLNYILEVNYNVNNHIILELIKSDSTMKYGFHNKISKGISQDVREDIMHSSTYILLEIQDT